MQLQMLCQGFRREASIKKMSSKLRMAKSFIVCKIYWSMSAEQGLVFYLPSFYTCTKFSSMGLTSYLSSAIFEMAYKGS